MMRYDKNLMAAMHANHYVYKKMKVGAANKISDVISSGLGSLLCVYVLRDNDISLATHPVPDVIRKQAAKAESMGCGNCGEQAALAFMYLYEKGIKPIEYMSLMKPGDHAFVVIGRKQETATHLPNKWNKSAVICDPWEKKEYVAHEFYTKMSGGVKSKPSLDYRSG